MKKSVLLKKGMALCMAAALAIPAMSTAAEAAVHVTPTAPSAVSQIVLPEAKRLDKGDVTGDGKITTRDALRALQISAGIIAPSEQEAYRADVDSSGAVSAEDALYVLQGAVGKYTNYGYEKPESDRVIYVDNRTIMSNAYCYNTLGEALKYVKSHAPTCEEERITILFAPGTYREQTTLETPYVTYGCMDPESEEPVNLTFYYGCGRAYYSLNKIAPGAKDGPSSIIEKTAHDFIAIGIRFENSYNLYLTEEEYTDFCTYPYNTDLISKREYDICASTNQTQALALRVDADRCQFYDCDIISRQDTLLMNGNGNRVYFENCLIEGTVDFIYGNGTGVFESCKINMPYHSGHVTAASTADKQPYGFLFNECTLTKEMTAPILTKTSSKAPSDDSYSLGRPWNGKSMVSYMNCKMDTHIQDKNCEDNRFVPMGGGAGVQPEVCRYSEYNTMDINGTPENMTEICPEYEKILTDEDVAGFYHPYHWLAKRYNISNGTVSVDDNWNPANYPIPE